MDEIRQLGIEDGTVPGLHIDLSDGDSRLFDRPARIAGDGGELITKEGSFLRGERAAHIEWCQCLTDQFLGTNHGFFGGFHGCHEIAHLDRAHRPIGDEKTSGNQGEQQRNEAEDGRNPARGAALRLHRISSHRVGTTVSPWQ